MRAKRKQFRAKVAKYTVDMFHAEYPDDAACLERVFQSRFSNGVQCEACGLKDSFHRVPNRKFYACSCGFQISPTAGTIFHKSPTPLKTWFFAMFLMSASKNGVAALELQRQIGVTYKCAWRMCHQIRELMGEELPLFTGTVEVDETYVGGKRQGKRGRGAEGKTIVVAALERGGGVAPFVVSQANAETAENLLAITTDKEAAKINTDEYGAYHGLKAAGYNHDTVNHSQEQWTKGDVHTQNIEGFWSQMKRSIDGTHHHVSKKHLQAYADEYAFRFNRRRSETPMFSHLVSQLAEKPV
jgi:transposase